VLGTITPLGERGRGNTRWFRVALTYIASASVSGALVGTVLAVSGLALTALTHWSGRAMLWPALAFAALAVLLDVRGQAARVPHFRRQVNSYWPGEMRPWAYAVGFGSQLGLGFTTHVVSAVTYAAFLCAFFSHDVLIGLTIGASFGFVRGMLVMLTRGVTSPSALIAMHTRVSSAERHSRRVLHLASAAVIALVALSAALT